MKLKVRIVDEAEMRDAGDRSQARREAQAGRTSWPAGEHSLHQEFSRIVAKEQPVFQLRVQGPNAPRLNRELAGLEFVCCRGWYHPASETVVVERYTGDQARAVTRIDLRSAAIRDLASTQRIVWRSVAGGSVLLHDQSTFSVLDSEERVRVLLSDHKHGEMIDDMLIAFNESDPRLEVSLVDPVLLRREDHLSSQELAAQLGIEISREMSLRFAHRSDSELCFELVSWRDGRCTTLRNFAIELGSIALGTIDE